MSSSRAVLDRILPRFTTREYHETIVRSSPEAALSAILTLPAESDAIVRALFALRGLRAHGKTIDDALVEMGLRPHRTDREYAGEFSPVSGLRIAVAFWSEPHGDGARLATETRVLAEGRARAAFALYWTVVGPFSALIRRRWLAAARRRAEASSQTAKRAD